MANPMAWLKSVRVGDIVRSGRGTERVVRAVHHYKSNTTLTFVILHCSWTERCYTVYHKADLRTMGYRPTGKRLRLTDRMSKRIDEAINVHCRDLSHRNGRTPNCCTVEGIR